MAWVAYPWSASRLHSDTTGTSFTVVLYGYSPAPKYVDLIPVNTSNSELAVPAPRAGTVKYPDGYSSLNLSKLGSGFSLIVSPFRPFG